MCRASGFFGLLVVVVIAAPAGGFEWEYVGMQGVATTCIAVDDEHDRVFVGTYEGFHYYEQETAVWTERDDEGWIGRQVHAILGHPWIDGRVITGRENAFFKGYLELSDDFGATGEIVHMSQGGSFVALEYDGLHVFAGGISDITPGELLRSADDGETWTLLTGHGQTAITAIATRLGLYAAGDNRVWVSWDDGESWEFIGDGLPPGEMVWAILADHPGGDVINPHLLAGTASGIYEAYQFGATDWDWQQRSNDPCVELTRIWVPAPWPINVIVDYAAVTADGRVLFADTGEVWSDATGDLPGAAVDVAYSRWDNGLYVTTANQGVYRSQGVITASETPPPAAAPVSLQAWPNPFNPRVNLRFELPASGSVRLCVYDATGRRVAVLDEGWHAAGAHEVSWAAEGLASGVYLARVETPAGTATERLVLVR